MLLAAAGVTLLVLLDERRGAAVLAAAARLDPRARSGMLECRLALPGLVDAVAAALSSGLSVQLALSEVAPTLPRGLALPTERAAASMALGASVDEAVGAYAGVVAGEYSSWPSRSRSSEDSGYGRSSDSRHRVPISRRSSTQ